MGGSAIYSSRAVERMLGVSADDIASWQARHLPAPLRSPGGQVLYSRDDVERLRWVAAELAAGRDPATAPATGAPARPDADPEGPPGLLVLLAERDPMAAQLAEFFLRTEGYRVETAFSAEEALALASVARPDLALVELTLTGHDGTALCRRLRDLSGAAVIAVSSLDRRDTALAGGAEAFLLKPLDPLELVSTVKDLLGASAYLSTEGAEPR